MKSRAVQVMSVGLVLLLTGCQASHTPPTEANAQAVWHHIAAQNHVDTVRELLSLRKTDGQASNLQGTEVYTHSYQARVRYLGPVGKWKTGDVQVVDSNYGFHRTERGWQGPDGTIYTK